MFRPVAKTSINNASGNTLTKVGGLSGGSLFVVAIVLSLLTTTGFQRFAVSYLIAWCFFLSISLGGIFFVVLQHLVGARWSVSVRRVAELLMTPIPMLGLLSLPLLLPMLFGSSMVYSWNDAAVRANDSLVQSKAAYLNAPFFVLRSMIYFGVWSLIAGFYFRASKKQDANPSIDWGQRMKARSGPAMFAFAITVNFASYDYLMSLEPHWFSSIFGIYFFAGCVVAILATLPLALGLLQSLGRMQDEVTVEHYHDLGKLLFGFVFFWGYIAFSQYILIWYANIPEETFWYLKRQQGLWLSVSLLLVFGHFILPFFGLMSRSVRRNRQVLIAWCCFMLVMHWVDLMWLVLPAFSGFSPSVIDLFCLAAVGTFWGMSMLREAKGIRLVPVGDPSLEQSIQFHAE